ncbi:hypothetical protein [Thalassoroseus pseudoceratinae]|uniref:hypothetical protein n=1 Tax=Thalassoroseus pseudoceratinae TaxID=2713176 RepID=UPI001421B5AC|nr:hypothetical protein [Thalassoroseus pseudoceratinae]
MPDSQPQLKLRHDDRIFGPVSFEQVQELLTAGKVQKTDSVREDDGPWIQIQDYLDWKAEQQTPVADISELLGGSDTSGPSEKPAQPSQSSSAPPAKRPAGSSSTIIPDDAPLIADDDDPLPVEPKPKKASSSSNDYMPLADSEPEAKNQLAETAEVPKTDSHHRKPKSKSGSASSVREQKRKSSGGSSASARSSKAGKSGSGVRANSKSGEQRKRRQATGRSSQATQSFRLPDDADLDSILRAMATYEMTAESLDSSPAQSTKKRRRKS